MSVSYTSRLRQLGLGLMLSTYYKRGFNGRLSLDLSGQRYSGKLSLGSSRQLSLEGELSYQHKALQIKGSVLAEHFYAQGAGYRQLYLNGEARYQLSPQLSLLLEVRDALHLSQRIRQSLSSSPLYQLHLINRQMPGYIIVGLKLKY